MRKTSVPALGAIAMASVLPATSALSVEIDGRMNPGEWAGATYITDFRKVQPQSGEPVSLPTEAWILATPEGLAAAFRNTQPDSVPRTRQWVRRDFSAQVDRVNLSIDFDGDGRTGYNFCVAFAGGIYDAVLNNEGNFNADWDGNWRHAVSEDAEGWTVEILIPWHIAPMQKAEGATRTIMVYVDRVIGSTGERSAWPAASSERSRYLSDFAPFEVPTYSQALLAVTPYASGLYDNVAGKSDSGNGADLFWKPNGQFQLSATVNPDFGQVESDDLVVNFSATETFVRDKRPFFTENQGLFQLTTPSESSQLLYTRRIGAPADDGSGASDITAAAKINGSRGATKYGLFSAREGGAAGRSFNALRVVRDSATQNLGALWVRTDRPFLDRRAEVLGLDHEWRPNARWNLRTRLLGSQIRQAGADSRDAGATFWADYHMGGGWRQQWVAMRFGEDLQINDAGYLARADLGYLHWELRRRFDGLPTESRHASKEWRWRITHLANNQGQKLSDQFRITRQSLLRNGGRETLEAKVISAGLDDELTRGRGALRVPARFDAMYQLTRPRKGRWAHVLEARTYSGGLSGNSSAGAGLQYEPTFFVSDGFSVSLDLYADYTPDWLVWQHDNLIGSFTGRETHLGAGLEWSIGSRQELRIKLQAVAAEGRLNQAYRVDPAGRALPVDEPVSDFSVARLGFQVRYRYELAPLSYLYVVYGRGGNHRQDYAVDRGPLLRESFSLRDDEQLLVKLSYRFES